MAIAGDKYIYGLIMRKSSLSLLQRFPCPRNQKRTWDLYERQILMGVKEE